MQRAVGATPHTNLHRDHLPRKPTVRLSTRAGSRISCSTVDAVTNLYGYRTWRCATPAGCLLEAGPRARPEILEVTPCSRRSSAPSHFLQGLHGTPTSWGLDSRANQTARALSAPAGYLLQLTAVKVSTGRDAPILASPGTQVGQHGQHTAVLLGRLVQVTALTTRRQNRVSTRCRRALPC